MEQCVKLDMSLVDVTFVVSLVWRGDPAVGV